MKNKDLFIADLIRIFPNLEEEILDEDYSFSITLQMGSLKRYIQKAIDDDNSDLFDAVVAFLNENLPLVDKKVQNTIFISFLEKLDFSGTPKFKQKLVGTLRRAHGYWKLHDRKKIPG
ncbi:MULTISPECIES: DUF7674 family protein [Sphingobacterium]|uniref:DUF7674 domain-containing protein n=1 Tax=Sphingobacterium siyangense TaxID=459529 RepID=A0A562MVG3_9SPHI|nr:MULTISPECIES: hypothetical protein [Sphingobacterium]MBB1646286.1 hypothetical protein [Sphingobacterium sp. UME9]TWI23889.1 hypothetical protein IQ31_00905 [Sphingobacterium siyangense]